MALLERPEKYDESRFVIEDDQPFKPFFITKSGVAVDKSTQLHAKTQVVIFKVGNCRGGLLQDEVAFHHVVQGVIDNQPFAVGFCVVCQAGVQITPIIGTRVVTLRLGGLYNGMAALKDDETGTIWELMTGIGMFGPLQGH